LKYSDGSQIERVEIMKYLYIAIDDKLQFKAQENTEENKFLK